MRRSEAYGALFLGLLLVSTSGPFVVMAHVDAYAIVLWRTLFAGIVFAAIAVVRNGGRLRANHLAQTFMGGVLLGAHFLLWVKAFDLTNFASNLILLVSQPIVALFLGLRQGEPATRGKWIALVLSTAGLLAIAGADVALGARALVGDVMCIVSGFLITLFYATTKRARAETPLADFMAVTLFSCALTALPIVFLTKAPLWGYAPQSWAWLGGLALVTTLGGHGLFNLAARGVSLFALNVVIVLEPALALLMGAILFGARATAVQAGGGLLLGFAVWIGLKSD